MILQKNTKKPHFKLNSIKIDLNVFVSCIVHLILDTTNLRKPQKTSQLHFSTSVILSHNSEVTKTCFLFMLLKKDRLLRELTQYQCFIFILYNKQIQCSNITNTGRKSKEFTLFKNMDYPRYFNKTPSFPRTKPCLPLINLPKMVCQCKLEGKNGPKLPEECPCFISLEKLDSFPSYSR